MPGKLTASILVMSGLGFVAGGAVNGIVGRTAIPAGSLEGRVIFKGSAPPGEPVQMQADPFCSAAHSEPVLARPVRVDAAGGLGDAFVYVKGASGPAASRAAPVLDQVGCLYVPYALAVRSGEVVIFRNSDQTLHNINVQPRANPGFNVGQPFAGMQIERSFGVAEMSIPVRCDVHPWMQGWISVFDHPFFAVSAADGGFRIDGIPAGDWVLETWHAHLGTQTRQITVADTATVTVEVGYGE